MISRDFLKGDKEEEQKKQSINRKYAGKRQT